MNPRVAAFDFIAGCLGVRDDPELDRALRSLIGSRALNWDLILAMAAQQKIAPALWAALRKRDLAGSLPAPARDSLFKLHLLNTFKNKALKEQAVAVVTELNALGVEPLLLKGGAALFVPTFEDPGARVMADLDLLVPAEAAQTCWDALCDAGYAPIADPPNVRVDYARHHHLRPLYRPREHGTVEIHRDGLPESAARVLPTSALWAQAETVTHPGGLRLNVPSATHRVLHNVLHADWINGTHARGQIALRSLHELAALQATCGAEIDWEQIRQRMDRGGYGRILRASVYLAHRCLGQPLPAGWQGTTGAWLHYARARFQVRWSRLNRAAEWMDGFSARNICERYRCQDDFWSVGSGRLRLAAQLSWKRAKRLGRLETL